MNREELERMFQGKITTEMKLFQEWVLQLEKEEIFALAYRIDCTIRIYEILMEFSKEISERELEVCNSIEGLLDIFYERWRKEPDSQEEELAYSICSMIQEMCAMV